MSEDSRRFGYIDAMRAIAALSVLLVHVAGYLLRQADAPQAVLALREYVLNFIDLGLFGVALFFFISGYVVPFSLLKGQNLSDFWVHRIFRLYPPFWISLVAVIGVETYCMGERGAFSSSQVLANLTMVPQIFGAEPMSGIYWTLFVEMLFYVACSLLYACGLLGKLHVTAAIALGLSASTAVPVFLNETLATGLPVKYLPLHLSYLFAGTLVRLCLQDSSCRRWRLLSAVLVVQVALCALATGVMFDGPPGFGFFTRRAIFVAYVAACLCFILCVTLRMPNPPFLLRLGASSYSLYLLHWPVVVVLVALLPGGTAEITVPLLLLSILCSLVAAEASFRMFERPCIHWGRTVGLRLRRLG